MAIIQALLAAILRSAGTILNTAFGWATNLLFGKVPKDRQTVLAVIAFGSVIWLVVALGVAFPRFATFLLAFIPVPKWVDATWIRLTMLAAAVLLPAVVGGLALYMLDPAQRPKTLSGKALAVLKGYPYTFGLALTLILMTVFAPIMKARDLYRGWSSAHVPVLVEPGDYLDVVGDVERILHEDGVETRRTAASWMMRLPTRVLTWFAGESVEHLVADHLTVLEAKDLEILLHPADLVIRGKEQPAARAHALITEHLLFTKAHLTWTKESNAIEDRLAAIWRGNQAGADVRGLLDQLHGIEQELHSAKAPYEEWAVLFREQLQVERSLLRRAAGLSDDGQPLSEDGRRWRWDGSGRMPPPASRRADVQARGSRA